MIRSILRMSHILAGTVTLAAALAAISLAKGSVQHRVAGKVFVASGRAVLATALVSCAWALAHPNSFVRNMTEAEIADIATPLRLFFGVLAVLLLLVAGDLETGLAGIRPNHPARFGLLGSTSMIAGATLLAGGLYGVSAGLGGVAWFAVGLGIIGVGDGNKVRNRVVSTEPLVSHLTGMIGAASGFLAAFLVFGGGRLLPVSFVEGDVLAAAPILLAMVMGHLLTSHWAAKVRTDETVAVPG